MLKQLIRYSFLSVTFFLVECAGLSSDSVQNEVGQAINLDQLPAQDKLPKFSSETACEACPMGGTFIALFHLKRIRFIV